MNVVPSDQLPIAELAAIFNEGYSDYFVPFHIDEAAMRHIVDAWDIDLARSRAVADVGLCNLGVRGDRGWIGGIAVVPSARRQGVGRLLMDAVLEVAPPVVTLEVIEQNEPAIALYEQLGFETTRLLEVWQLPEVAEVEAQQVEPAPLGQSDLPWQREDGSLPAEYERWEVDGGAMLLRGGNVLQLEARDVDAAVALLSRGMQLSYVNVPEGDVASAALATLGGTMSMRQYEMRLVR